MPTTYGWVLLKPCDQQPAVTILKLVVHPLLNYKPNRTLKLTPTFTLNLTLDNSDQGPVIAGRNPVLCFWKPPYGWL